MNWDKWILGQDNPFKNIQGNHIQSETGYAHIIIFKHGYKQYT